MQGVVYVVCVSERDRSGLVWNTAHITSGLDLPEQNHSLSYSHPRPWGCGHNSQIFTSKHILRNNGTLWRLRTELCLLAYLVMKFEGNGQSSHMIFISSAHWGLFGVCASWNHRKNLIYTATFEVEMHLPPTHCWGRQMWPGQNRWVSAPFTVMR